MASGPIPTPSRAEDSGHAADDYALIRRVKAGDQSAFEDLFRRHVARVYRQAFALVGNEAEAEEVVQEVFLTVYTKASQFREAAAFTTWLYRLTATGRRIWMPAWRARSCGRRSGRRSTNYRMWIEPS